MSQRFHCGTFCYLIAAQYQLFLVPAFSMAVNALFAFAVLSNPQICVEANWSSQRSALGGRIIRQASRTNTIESLISASAFWENTEWQLSIVPMD